MLTIVLFWASLVTVAYHHVGFPPLLKLLARRARPVASRSEPAVVPTVSVLIPAYQEAQHIRMKLENLAALDYPRDRLSLIVACDGCTDGTDQIAAETIAGPACAGLNAEVRSFAVNRGKVAVLNEVITGINAEIVGLSDVTSSLAPDGLRRAVAHFADPTAGFVCPTYALRQAGSAGEAAYWAYQTGLKADEAALGSPMGAHGAFYLFRRDHWRPLPPDTINDDFILPMRIVLDGLRGIYDRSVVAYEEETSRPGDEFRRRVRIGAGNLQQAVRLFGLANPRRPGIAFTFLSGKALRAVVPFLLILILLCNVWLAIASGPVYRWILALQIAFYMLAALVIVTRRAAWPGPARWAAYFVEGHVANLLGSVRYLAGLDRGRWTRAAAMREGGADDVSAEQGFSHPVVEVGKRTFDITVASLALAVLAVLYVPIAIAIRLDSKGPVLYRQLRVGRATPRYTELFRLIKFRSMRVDAEAATGPVWSAENDPRITATGRFLRKTRLDELPQCINVLRGEMSIVGPRPERPSFFSELEAEIPFYIERTYGLRPGITGLAQVNQGYDASVEDVRSKVLYDHAYAMHLMRPLDWLRTDLSIIVKTITVMAFGKGR
jgi:lipopolysaccharide/colanic/teichoic acid biosynthesis glycosyltransferase/cellulose synthase/poly-beta-1,6-N-acetylglucosamine synthase-like glycosyltransferase